MGLKATRFSSLKYRLLNYSGEQSYRHKWIDYFNTLQIMKTFPIKSELAHAKTMADLLETAEYFGKDTKRKKSIFFKKWIVDCNYIIDHIEPQISKKGFAHHLGEILYPRHLKSIKAERDLIINSFDKLTK